MADPDVPPQSDALEVHNPTATSGRKEFPTLPRMKLCNRTEISLPGEKAIPPQAERFPCDRIRSLPPARPIAQELTPAWTVRSLCQYWDRSARGRIAA